MVRPARQNRMVEGIRPRISKDARRSGTITRWGTWKSAAAATPQLASENPGKEDNEVAF